MLAEITLPSVAKGLFYIGMLATIMSSLNTLAFVSATTLGRDIVLRWRRRHNDGQAAQYTRMGLVVTATLSVVLALLIPSVIKLWYTIGTVMIPGLLVPLVTSYFDRWRVEARYAFFSMLFGWLTSFGWLVSGWSVELGGNYPFGIEPMYPGLLISITMWCWGMSRMHQVAFLHGKE
jgi:SSS family solute:Na+ symporter